MQSQDIRQLVQKEGKSARNLVAWSVPVSDLSPKSAAGEENNEGFQTVTKRIRRNRQRPRPVPGPKPGSYINESTKRPTRSKTAASVSSSNEKRAPRVSEEVCAVVAEHYSDMHAKQRDRSSKLPRIDIHARYWSYLFDNLHRAVDEIYATCEADESVIECQVRTVFPRY